MFGMNSDNTLLVVEERNFDWRSESVSPEVRNDKDRVIVMKTTICLEWKWQGVRKENGRIFVTILGFIHP
jgi:hypothetical protein